MRIEPSQNLISGIDPREAGNTKPETLKNVSERLETAQGDRAEISLKSSLSIFNESAAQSGQALDVQLSSDRATEIQQKVRSGFYKTDLAIGRAADGILELYSA
jgi:anti-sigma28 factor (negative regulator of flagellin synthesis)